MTKHISGPSPFQHLIFRKPYVIGREGGPYMRRWWVIPRNRFCNIYLHHFLRDDDDRALHDHPWSNVSILLRGSYYEHTDSGATLRSAPTIVFRKPECAHRISLVDGNPVWTLFLTGPKVREWGFWCPQGWRHWRDFTADDGANVGKGCAE